MYFYDDCYIKASFPSGTLQATVTTVNNGDGTYTHTATIPTSYPNAMTITTSSNLLFRKESAYISVTPQFYLISAGQTAECHLQYTNGDGNIFSSDSTSQLTLSPSFYKNSVSLTTSSPNLNYGIMVKTDLTYFTFQRKNGFWYAPKTIHHTLQIKNGPVSSGTTISMLDEPVVIYSPDREVERYQIETVKARDTIVAMPLIANGTSVKRLTVKTGVKKTTDLIHKWTHLNRMCNKIVFGQINNTSEDVNQLKCVGTRSGGITLSWNTLPDVLKINVGLSEMETVPSSITGGTLEVRGIFLQRNGIGTYDSCTAVGAYTFSDWNSSTQVATFNLNGFSGDSGSFEKEDDGFLMLGFGGRLSIVFYGTTYTVTMPTLISKYQWFKFPSSSLIPSRTATLTIGDSNPSVYGQWNMSTASWYKVY